MGLVYEAFRVDAAGLSSDMDPSGRWGHCIHFYRRSFLVLPSALTWIHGASLLPRAEGWHVSLVRRLMVNCAYHRLTDTNSTPTRALISVVAAKPRVKGGLRGSPPGAAMSRALPNE